MVELPISGEWDEPDTLKTVPTRGRCGLEAQMLARNRKRILALPLLLALALVVGLFAGSAGAAIHINVTRGEFTIHVRPISTTAIPQNGLTVEISNVKGDIAEFTLPAGACVVAANGRTCSYRDTTITPTSGAGIQYFRTDFASRRIWLRAFGDLSKATTPDMTVALYASTVPDPTNSIGSVYGIFGKTSNGWILSGKKGTWY
jgi:hypothetical protein